jgi:hypothetical protein
MTALIWPAFAAWIDALALARSLDRDSMYGIVALVFLHTPDRL